MVSELFRKVQDGYIQQRELGWRKKGLRQQPSTAASHFLQSLTGLTTRLERYQHMHHTDTELSFPKLWVSLKANRASLEGMKFHCVRMIKTDVVCWRLWVFVNAVTKIREIYA